MATKGGNFEEVVREYFSRRGFLAIRGVPFQHLANDVTDLDLWLYGKQPSGFRLRAIVDAKNKRSPKAFERILWVRGLQAITNSDKSFVATTDASPTVAKFGQENQVLVISSSYLSEIVPDGNGGRFSNEEFEDKIREFKSWKEDGDWIKTISRLKSSVLNTSPFQSFNIACSAFKFFCERIHTRPSHKDVAFRCAVLSASFACLALDRGLENYQFRTAKERNEAIQYGIAYGDAVDGATKRSIATILDVIKDHIDGGKPMSSQVKTFFDELPASLRADIIADHFADQHHFQDLFRSARELERLAYIINQGPLELSIETKAALGVIADFCEVDRRLLKQACKSKEATGSQSDTAESFSEPPLI